MRKNSAASFSKSINLGRSYQISQLLLGLCYYINRKLVFYKSAYYKLRPAKTEDSS